MVKFAMWLPKLAKLGGVLIAAGQIMQHPADRDAWAVAGGILCGVLADTKRAK